MTDKLWCPFMSGPVFNGKTTTLQPVDCDPQVCALGNKAHNCCQLMLLGAEDLRTIVKVSPVRPSDVKAGDGKSGHSPIIKN